MTASNSSHINYLVELLHRYYLFPDVAEKVASAITSQHAAAHYDGLNDEQFAAAISADTIAASHDLHLRLRYSQQVLPPDHIVPESGRRPDEAEAEGHGIERMAELEGNVGLIDIRRLFPLSMSRSAMTEALASIADARALIVDLRHCAGGEPEMVAYVASHLFDARTHLVDLVFPADGTVIEWWTEWPPPEPRFGGAKPISVLIGPNTLSGGEGLAYDLQQTGRAVLIGQTTAGAANFDYRYRVSDHLMFSVPSGYPRNAVSGKGWEGDGVAPDVATPVTEALSVAHRLSLGK